MSRTRSYHDLLDFDTFEDRLEYLRLGGGVGRSTFGFDRYVNQRFYQSYEWKRVRNLVITRDNGCDLGIPDYPIHAEILIHHMNPIGLVDILAHADVIVNPDFLITTTKRTHNAIHYGGRSPYPPVVAQRTRNDTRLWGRR